MRVRSLRFDLALRAGHRLLRLCKGDSINAASAVDDLVRADERAGGMVMGMFHERKYDALGPVPSRWDIAEPCILGVCAIFYTLWITIWNCWPWQLWPK